ncbi:MAG: DUF3040 domain-containing protein [Bifidobacteriaceae bacterium]|jgi:hypothetical protein|nr:DUF3040 domain-containing protein [Bifidobacteriaceae bacterium]
MPLSEYEQRVLAEMEQQLTSDDPKLATSLTSSASPRRGRIALGIFLILLGLAVLVVGMTVSLIWLSLVGFAVMFVGGWVALSGPGRAGRVARSGGAGGKAPKPPRARFTQRFEDRWNDRRPEN